MRVWISDYEYDQSDPDCQPLHQWIIAGNWPEFFSFLFSAVARAEVEKMYLDGENVGCDPTGGGNGGGVVFRIYWHPCVDFTTIEVVILPLRWCKFGSCCIETLRLCVQEDGTIVELEHTKRPSPINSCQEEPGKFCVPMCDNPE